MQRRLLGLTLVGMAAAGLAAAPPQSSSESISQLLSAYVLDGPAVIERVVRNEPTFERLREDLKKNALARWHNDRHPVQAVFLLDLARVAYNRGWRYWLDVVDEGRRFVMKRAEAPGVDQAADAFEIAWHKTSFALLSGAAWPAFLEEQGVAPLKNRMSPAPLANGEPRLVDPWIELARGLVEEQWTIARPETLGKRAAAAIEHFDAAAAYETTRAEALVRKAWLLLRLGRPAEALAALDAIGLPGNNRSERYWTLLFRGRACEAVGEPDAAAAAYTQALGLVPHAQSALVALSILEFRRDRLEEASRWSTAVRTAPVAAPDPWAEYMFADARFFTERLRRLRELGK